MVYIGLKSNVYVISFSFDTINVQLSVCVSFVAPTNLWYVQRVFLFQILWILDESQIQVFFYRVIPLKSPFSTDVC